MRYHITLIPLTNWYLVVAIILVQISLPTSSKSQGVANSVHPEKGRKITLAQKASPDKRLTAFLHFDSLKENINYSITLCADLPDNNNPSRVHVKNETGHVFIILSEWNEKDTVCRVFGFYPLQPISSLLFKRVRCDILDNGRREYNVSLYKKLEKHEFGLAIQTAVESSKKKYDINKYNCYDYALEVFNSVAGPEKLPAYRIRFPFIFGRGGSPCGLYAQLKQIKNNDVVWSPDIKFGAFRAPNSK